MTTKQHDAALTDEQVDGVAGGLMDPTWRVGIKLIDANMGHNGVASLEFGPGIHDFPRKGRRASVATTSQYPF